MPSPSETAIYNSIIQTPMDSIEVATVDCQLVAGLLPKELLPDVFDNLRREVDWQVMMHRSSEVPRLVAVQGVIDEDGSVPIYRHPADASPPLKPFTPTVALIAEHASQTLGHPLNHVLIQLYRNGQDNISEHSDKTIDIVRGSNIVNVSFGAERVMVLRMKKDAVIAHATQTGEDVSRPITLAKRRTASGTPSGPVRPSRRIPLPHNSMLVMGLSTNRKALHEIRPDKRPESVKSPEQLAFNGERISLTFRYIGTFLSADESRIWGQGATSKMKETAKPVLNGDEEASFKLLAAFSKENHQSQFDWDEEYGDGSDVLHLSVS